MCFSKLRQEVINFISDDDPYKDPKRLQLDYWCSTFLHHIHAKDTSSSERGPLHKFYQEVLLDEECWEASNNPHGIKFNRRAAAQKMIAPRSWKGTATNLNTLQRYYIACLCCLEEDILELFHELHLEYVDLRICEPIIVKRLLKIAKARIKKTNPMLEFWSYFASGNIKERDYEGKSFHEYGLEKALSEWETRLETVEYFWNELHFDNSLNDREKDQILMNAAISAIGSGINCDVFEFCFSRLNPVHYPELLRRDLEMNGHHESFQRLQLAFRFDLCRKVFDCLKPSDIEEDRYSFWLSFMRLAQCPDHYIGGAVELITHMWTKVGFDRHRAYALKEELGKDSSRQGDLLLPLVKRNYMQAVWTILDEVRDEVGRELFKEFLKSRRADIIVNTLKDDQSSRIKFLSYKNERKRRSLRLETRYKREASGNEHQTM